MNKVIISSLILTCFIVFVGFLTINDKLQFIQNRIQYENQNRNNEIAGYRICINDYCSGLIKTEEKALEKMERLKKGIKPYPENLKYMSFDIISYEK